METYLSCPIVPNATPQMQARIPKIFSEDLMIVSYPRSGNTWVRFLVANLLANRQQPLDFAEMEELVPDIHALWNWDRIRAMPPGRYIKSHMPYDPTYKKVVYIVRDGRDVKVSQYHYRHPHLFPGTFLEFLQHSPWPGSWHMHIESWLNHADEESLLLVRYEDLLEKPAEQLRRIADFAGLPTDEDRIECAVHNSAFNSLKKIEDEKGHPVVEKLRGLKILRSDFKFFRKGTSGDWKEHFGPEHKVVFKPQSNPVLLRLSYIQDANW